MKRQLCLLTLPFLFIGCTLVKLKSDKSDNSDNSDKSGKSFNENNGDDTQTFMAGTEFCAWSKPEVLSSQNGESLSEASGVAVSTISPDNLLQIDDSSHEIYVTKQTGEVISKYDMKKGLSGEGSTKDWDPEALALGPCDLGSSCVYVGALGNNHGAERYLLIFAEKDIIKGNTKGSPGRAYHFNSADNLDFESLFVTSSSEIYIVSRSMPTTLYRVDLPLDPKDEAPLTKIRTLAFTPKGEITDAALSPNGSILALISKKTIYQTSFQQILSQDESEPLAVQTSPMPEGMPQAEGVAWTSKRSLIITTEKSDKKKQRILELQCTL